MDISKININGTSYDIKDAVARQALEGLTGAMHFIGTTTDELTENSRLTSLNITGIDSPVTAKEGDVVVYEDMEYVFNGTTWNKFGPAGSFGALAFKESATGTVKAVGTNSSSAVTLTGGSVEKLDTTSITSVSGTDTVHDTPTLTTAQIGSASAWNAGTMFEAEVSGDELILTSGTEPTLTITSTAVGTSLTAGSEKTFATAGSSVTVATGSTSNSGTGASVATSLPTGGTAAAQTFTGSDVSVTVQ